MSQDVVQQRGDGRQLAWALWIVVSVIAAVIGAVVAAQVRALATTPDAVGTRLPYVATIVDALIVSGAQWLLLRRYRLDVYWWVPATVMADLIAAIVVIPSVLDLFVPRGTTIPIFPTTAMVSGAVALAVAGFVIGVAQALVLRTSARTIAWAWVPATVVGGALAGAFTTAISAQLFGFPYLVTVSLVDATGGLLIAASQAPVLLRALR
jgi:hypothetical protein